MPRACSTSTQPRVEVGREVGVAARAGPGNGGARSAPAPCRASSGSRAPSGPRATTHRRVSRLSASCCPTALPAVNRTPVRDGRPPRGRARSGAPGRAEGAWYHPLRACMQIDQIGKYKIIGKIGQGAMGEVYKAHDAVLNRDGRDQDHQRRPRRRRDPAQALPARGPVRGPPQPPEHHHRLRLRRGARQDLHGHGAARGHRPQADDRAEGARSTLDEKLDDHGPDRRRPRLRPRRRHRPPRPEAGQHPPARPTARSRSWTSAWRASAARR